jgi:hypothetical protein
MLESLISGCTNGELVELVKTLKKNENNRANLLEYSKNFRYLLNQIREDIEISLDNFIFLLENKVTNEITERIFNNKIKIY